MQFVLQIVVEIVSQIIFETVLYGIGRAVCAALGMQASEGGVREQIVGVLTIVAAVVGGYLLLR